MGLFSKVKSKARRKSRKAVPGPKFFKKAKKYGKKARRYNERHDIIGLSPNNLISPIDALPPVAFYRKGKRAYDISKKLVKGTKIGSRVRNKYNKSRGRRSKSSSKRRKPRGKYYYYRGKRYSRK